ncbi:MAG: tryptophan synthase subunit beta, partial [Acidobacteriota bacterium]
FAGGEAGIFQGTHTIVLQDSSGNISGTHSVSAGLDYAAIGPEHAWLRQTGRAQYTHVSDDEALEGFTVLGRLEGILPALESAHAIVYACRLARQLGPARTILVNLSGRGDKDVQSVAARLGVAGE